MKKSTAILFALAVMNLALGQSDWEKMELKGKVKELKTITKNRKGDSWDKFSAYTATYLFSPSGYILSYEESYKPDYSTKAGFEAKESYEYNKNNQMVQKKVYEDEKEIDEVYTYEYDKKGRLTKEIKNDPFFNRNRITIYTYDRRGNLIKEKKDDDEEIYKYNKNNQLIEHQADFFGQAMLYTYNYDERGNRTEERRFANQKRLFTIFFKYDAANRLTEELTYDHNNKLVGKDEYKYNKEGRVIEKSKYGSRTIYDYDQYQNVIRDNSLRYTYVYDNEKNWTDKKTFTKDSPDPSTIEERIISYF